MQIKIDTCIHVILTNVRDDTLTYTSTTNDIQYKQKVCIQVVHKHSTVA